MIGEECPLPGSGIFQRMLFVSLQWTGGLARSATPLANGPRHCGQLSGGEAQALTSARSAKADNADKQARTTIRRSGHFMCEHCAPFMSRLSKVPRLAQIHPDSQP